MKQSKLLSLPLIILHAHARKVLIWSGARRARKGKFIRPLINGRTARVRLLFASEPCCNMSNGTGGLDCSNDWFLTSGYVGAVSSVAAIVLILCSRAYKDFFHRLYLYIAISALVLSVCWCVEQVIPIPENGESVESVFTTIGLALICVSSSLIALVTCWLSFHVFLMVMYVWSHEPQEVAL